MTTKADVPIIILFGRPGAGKTTIANEVIARKSEFARAIRDCGIHINLKAVDLDECIPQWMKDNFSKGIYPNLGERLAFATDACRYVQKQILNLVTGDDQSSNPRSNVRTAPCLLISFSFVNVDLRETFRSSFPHAHWVLIDTSLDESERRIAARDGHFYKGASANGNTENKDELENSEWSFAPVDFTHILIDGRDDVDSNAAKVVSLILEKSAVSLNDCLCSG